jgi:hypothetical protein
LQHILNKDEFQHLDPSVQAKMINVLHEQSVDANLKGKWPVPSSKNLYDMEKLLMNPSFAKASKEDQLAQLEALRPKDPVDLQ